MQRVIKEPMKNPVIKQDAVRASTSLITDRSLDLAKSGVSSVTGEVGSSS